jgi:hypothetical protein
MTILRPLDRESTPIGLTAHIVRDFQFSGLTIGYYTYTIEIHNQPLEDAMPAARLTVLPLQPRPQPSGAVHTIENSIR